MKRMIHHYGKILVTSALLCSALSLSSSVTLRADFFDTDDDSDSEDLEPSAESQSSVRKPLQSVRSPRHRDILYCLPTNQKFDFEFEKKKTYLAVTPFMNKASRMEFLADHINLKDLKGFLHDVTPVEDQSSLDATMADFLPIFQRFTDQEQKVGATLNFDFPFQRWTFSLETPFLLSLRNLWVPKKDQDRTREIFAAMPKDGPLKPEEVEAKLSELPYRVGFGDTRLKFAFVPIKSQLISTMLGFAVTVPTSRFCNPLNRTQTPEQASLTFAGIASQIQDAGLDSNAKDQVFKKVFNQVITTVQQISLRPSLGVGHWGMGVFAHSLVPLFEDSLLLWHKVSFDHFLPGHDLRYIISSKHTFPQEKEVVLSPGSVIHSVIGGDFKVARSLKLGMYYDSYYQCEEHIRRTHIKSEFLPFYNIEDIEKPHASQQKVGLDVTYLGRGWNMLVGGERVITHAGIGRGWSLFSEITCTF